MFERQPYHKHFALTSTESILMLGCLSLVLFLSPAYAQIVNPSSGNTIAKYCSDGVCHTPGGMIQTITQNVTQETSFNAPHPNLIGIQLSGTCLTYAKANMNSSCYSYKDLITLDNTDKFIAGKFIDIPYFHRATPLVKNFWAFTNSSLVMVDPNNSFTLNAKMIIVNIKNFTWIDKTENGTSGGQSVKYHIDRRMSGCDEAQVSSNYTLIRDTILYMESNCTVTNFNDTKVIKQKDIPFSYKNPFSTLLYSSYIKLITHGHTSSVSNHTAGGLGPSNCITNKCTYTDPYAKVGYK